MPFQYVAIASAKSFGDFVIAHSTLHRLEDPARDRVRLIACSHLKGLTAILPNDVGVTFVNMSEDRVPAIFDIKKRGVFAALHSAFSLRGRFQATTRKEKEVLVFDALGLRERFIAGRWPVTSLGGRAPNIYETYVRFFAAQGINVASARSIPATPARSVGIFPESRITAKRLTGATLSIIAHRTARAQLDAKVFVLQGDAPPRGESLPVLNISRSFESLAQAIKSVDCVISADSLPAHLAEYCGRPVYVASPMANEYWLPHACFANKRWGKFGDTAHLSASLDRFLADLGAL